MKLKPYFEPYIKTGDAIYEIFGDDCEVVIHDLENLHEAVVYLRGNVTGRKLGAPVTDFILKEMKKAPEQIQDINGMITTAQNGKKIKTSIVFIRDENENIVGVFGINFDLTTAIQWQASLDQLLKTKDGDANVQEQYGNTIDEVFENIIDQTFREMDIHPPIRSKEQRQQLVRLLDQKGVFLIKNSTDRVAEILNVSKQTIYNDLDHK